MKWTIFFLSAAIAFLLADAYCIRIYKNSVENLIITDREYWRMVASSPEIACRKRGGEFRVTYYKTDFKTYTQDYVCKGMKGNEVLWKTSN